MKPLFKTCLFLPLALAASLSLAERAEAQGFGGAGGNIGRPPGGNIGNPPGGNVGRPPGGNMGAPPGNFAGGTNIGNPPGGINIGAPPGGINIGNPPGGNFVGANIGNPPGGINQGNPPGGGAFGNRPPVMEEKLWFCKACGHTLGTGPVAPAHVVCNCGRTYINGVSDGRVDRSRVRNNNNTGNSDAEKTGRAVGGGMIAAGIGTILFGLAILGSVVFLVISNGKAAPGGSGGSPRRRSRD